MPTQTYLIPALRYENAPAAIDFLCRAFGFTRHAVYADPNDPAVIHHAQLLRDGTMLMLGSAQPDAAGANYHFTTPSQAGGVTTVLCAFTADPDAHAAIARAAGAEIITAPADNQGYPGRSYSVRDTGGHIWSFSNYDPFTES
jgi:uncharacterized glyoxalase superfamily protein PhnB